MRVCFRHTFRHTSVILPEATWAICGLLFFFVAHGGSSVHRCKNMYIWYKLTSHLNPSQEPPLGSLFESSLETDVAGTNETLLFTALQARQGSQKYEMHSTS